MPGVCANSPSSCTRPFELRTPAWLVQHDFPRCVSAPEVDAAIVDPLLLQCRQRRGWQFRGRSEADRQNLHLHMIKLRLCWINKKWAYKLFLAFSVRCCRHVDGADIVSSPVAAESKSVSSRFPERMLKAQVVRKPCSHPEPVLTALRGRLRFRAAGSADVQA